MANAFQQNIQDVWKKWESKSTPNIKPRSSFVHETNYMETRRQRQRPNMTRSASDSFSHFERKKRNKFPLARLPRYHSVFQFKMAPSVLPLNKDRPYVGLCCMKCLPRSRAALVDLRVQSLRVCNLLQVPFMGKLTGFLPSSLHLLYFMFSRSAKFKYPDISAEVLQCKRLSSAITSIIEQSDLAIASSAVAGGQPDDSLDVLTSKQRTKAQEIMCDMKVSMNQYFLKISSLFVYKTLCMMLQNVQVHKGQLETLKLSCEEDYPIIYVPTHRSHFDFVLVSLILYMNNLKVPMLVIGDNIIPFFQKILKLLGVLFVNSKCGLNSRKNALYQAVLQSYVIESLKVGHSMEISIDGGHSHIGKPCSSESNLLSLIIDAVLKGDIEDVYLAPVSIIYEKFMEDNYLYHQLGKSKSSGSFLSHLFSIWKMLHTDFGSVRVNFCQPFSLKEYLQSNNHLPVLPNSKISSLDTPPSSPNSSCSSHSSPCEDFSVPKHLKTVFKNLANHIIYDATCSTTLMSTHLVAFLLLVKHRKGATLPQLLCSFNWLKEELLKRKRDVGFSGNWSTVIKHAIALLGKDLIETEVIELEWTSSDMENNNVKVLFHKPVVKLPYVLELQYYANVAVPVFFLDSVVVNALYAVIDDDICHFQLCDSKLFVWKDELVEKAIELCNLLRFEYLSIPPCADLVCAINDVINELIAKECLVISGVGKYSNSSGRKVYGTRTSHTLSFEASDDEDMYHTPSVDQHLKVDLSEESIDHLKFLRNVLSPCIESYWLTACTLLKLIDEVMEEKEFLREIQRTAEDRLHKNLLGYEESFGTDTLKNSLKVFEYLEVIEHCYENGLKFFYLSESYDSEEKLNDIISRIEVFRQ